MTFIQKKEGLSQEHCWVLEFIAEDNWPTKEDAPKLRSSVSPQ